MSNVPPRDPTPRAKADRRNYIAIAVVAVVLVIGAIIYFSSQDRVQDTATPPASTESAPTNSAPADNNSGTTTTP